MDLGAKLKKVATGGVFGDAAHVSEITMRTASVTAADPFNENAVVAQDLKRHIPELLDQLIEQ